MNDVLLIKKLDQFNIEKAVPVTFNIGKIEDKSIAMHIFNTLKEKNLLSGKKLTITNDSITLFILCENITKVIEELIKYKQKIYGVYILYDNYLGGK